jgi:hypothetical protein
VPHLEYAKPATEETASVPYYALHMSAQAISQLSRF